MSATMPHEPFEPGDLAGEYVLGVLDADERRAAAARIESDRGFAAEVSWWENRLAPLVAAIAPVAPPAYVWARIRAALGQDRAAPERTPPRVESAWQRVGVWRWLSAGALALAAASMVALFVGRREPLAPPQAPLVAVMVLDSGAPAFVATIDRAAGTMIVTPVSAWTDAGHVPELWLIPKGEKKAYSLGVVDTAKPITVNVPADLRRAIGAAAIVAISVEPPGGSPTGQATGPIIAKGGISDI